MRIFSNYIVHIFGANIIQKFYLVGSLITSYFRGCDHCEEWFHGDCVGISHEEADDIASYACQSCQSKYAHIKTKYHNKRRRRARRTSPPPPPCCHSTHCSNPSAPPSRYCTMDCGLRQADDNLLRLLQQFVPPSTIEECESQADKESLAELDRIRTELSLVDARLSELEYLRTVLDAHVKDVTVLIYDTINAGGDPRSVVTDSDAMIDCFSCGNTFPLQKAILHMHKCYANIESEVEVLGEKAHVLAGCPVQAFCNAYDKSSGKYCHRLYSTCPKHKSSGKLPTARADAVCGYPFDGPFCATLSTTSTTVEREEIPIKSFCKQRKRTCVAHSTWDKLHTTRLELETVQQYMYRAYLKAQTHDIAGRMSRRHTMVSSVRHETVSHTAAEAQDIHTRATSAAKKLRESHAIASRSKVIDDMEKSQTTGLWAFARRSVCSTLRNCPSTPLASVIQLHF